MRLKSLSCSFRQIPLLTLQGLLQRCWVAVQDAPCAKESCQVRPWCSSHKLGQSIPNISVLWVQHKASWCISNTFLSLSLFPNNHFLYSSLILTKLRKRGIIKMPSCLQKALLYVGLLMTDNFWRSRNHFYSLHAKVLGKHTSFVQTCHSPPSVNWIY